MLAALILAGALASALLARTAIAIDLPRDRPTVNEAVVVIPAETPRRPRRH
ncbi:MAG: hypothetical protein KAH44_02695 [Oricola sp.]|jgi:hypothetical protein|nr:hypothetical protein [Oricola sp.]